MAEIFRNRDIEFNPENIDGHEFRVPLVEWNGHEYGLCGLHLPHDWQDEISRLKDLDNGYLLRATGIEYDDRKFFNCRLIIDDSSGLMMELQVIKTGEEKSRVYLDTSSTTRSGMYVGENIKNLGTAIQYLKVLSRYLTIVSDVKEFYPYIESAGYDSCYSENLIVPEMFRKIKNKIASAHIINKAHRITGQFGTVLRNIIFNEEGLISQVDIESNACEYVLDKSNYSYYPHNVDNSFQVATLHGIVAMHINELLKSDSSESWV